MRADPACDPVARDRERAPPRQRRVQRADDAVLEDHAGNPIGPARRVWGGDAHFNKLSPLSAALGLAGWARDTDPVPQATPRRQGGGQAISVSAREFAFDPGTIQIDQPGTYTFTLTNDGSFGHALEVEGQGVEEETSTVAPGSSGQVTVTFSKTGSYEFYCPVDGHRPKGMEGTLTVGAASGGTGTTEDNAGTRRARRAAGTLADLERSRSSAASGFPRGVRRA